jgi:hypothetical protein
MKPRNLLAIAILVLGSLAAFYSYTRLAELLPMSDPMLVEQTEAVVTEVTTPMVKKGQGVSDGVSAVRFTFEASGRTIEGGYSIKGRDAAPEKGAAVPIAYRIDRPEIFLPAADYDALPRELAGLRWMMWIFALVAMIAPFAVMKHGASS